MVICHPEQAICTTWKDVVFRPTSTISFKTIFIVHCLTPAFLLIMLIIFTRFIMLKSFRHRNGAGCGVAKTLFFQLCFPTIFSRDDYIICRWWCSIFMSTRYMKSSSRYIWLVAEKYFVPGICYIQNFLKDAQRVRWYCFICCFIHRI